MRLSLDISSELNNLLETLAGETRSSKSDVLRRSIALFEVAVEAKKQGRKFGVAADGQELAREIVGLFGR